MDRGAGRRRPAAICRKVAEAGDGGTIEFWVNGSAVRSYTYVDDMIDGIYRLMQSDMDGPVNSGAPEVTVRYVPGPVGVQSRNFSNTRVYSLGWRARSSLEEGIGRTYRWIAEQVRAQRAGARSAYLAPVHTAVG